MAEGETDNQSRERIKQLEREIEILKATIRELEARLAKYENPHTPPSLRRGRNRGRDQKEGEVGKPGQKIGHEGGNETSCEAN
jgi:transposase